MRKTTYCLSTQQSQEGEQQLMSVVDVRYLGSFSALTRKRAEKVTISDNENLETLLGKLERKYGRKLRRSLAGGTTAFLVNGTAAEKGTVLHHGDQLTIATMVGGG